jgi:hypothetical protein
MVKSNKLLLVALALGSCEPRDLILPLSLTFFAAMCALVLSMDPGVRRLVRRLRAAKPTEIPLRIVDAADIRFIDARVLPLSLVRSQEVFRFAALQQAQLPSMPVTVWVFSVEMLREMAARSPLATPVVKKALSGGWTVASKDHLYVPPQALDEKQLAALTPHFEVTTALHIVTGDGRALGLEDVLAGAPGS